jgi:guanosine-diphosphatase
MIDAGSTGSRIHVYKFNNCGSSPEYEYEVFKMTQPGLSTYADKPEEGAKSLDVLLDEAVRVIPQSLQKCAPIAVKATAGLRLLPGTQSDDILRAVENHIRDNYPFPLTEKDPVVVMDGKEEGVYAWITANYLLNTIRSGTPKNTPTYAVLDLGGASTQIVFEPVFTSDNGRLEEGEHKYDLIFGGKKHVLYQHSYLGYGLMRARKHVHRLVDFMASIRISPSNKEVENQFIGNPCLAKGTRRVVEIEDEGTGARRNVTMDGDDIGSLEACDRVIQLVLAKDA